MQKSVLIISWFALLFCLSACNETVKEKQATRGLYLKVSGETMGTYYNISYRDSLQRNFKSMIDSLLVAINQEVSTYIDSSTISKFNQMEASDEALVIPNNHFSQNLRRARDIYTETEGIFDPTVMPLVNYWGFGYTPKRAVVDIDSVRIDSIMEFVGFRRLKIKEIEKEQLSLVKPRNGIQLDFSALAKGYAVDEIGKTLEQEGVLNYLIDIGGEMLAKGKNAGDGWWQVGIRTPKKGASNIESILSLENKALATSGNYENFHEVGNRKYGHTINPLTGYPEMSSLLSATVMAKDGMTADAYATAFMVMGLDKAFEVAAETEDIEACFIYGNEEGDMSVMYTEGLKGKIY